MKKQHVENKILSCEAPFSRKGKFKSSKHVVLAEQVTDVSVHDFPLLFCLHTNAQVFEEFLNAFLFYTFCLYNNPSFHLSIYKFTLFNCAFWVE